MEAVKHQSVKTEEMVVMAVMVEMELMDVMEWMVTMEKMAGMALMAKIVGKNEIGGNVLGRISRMVKTMD